MYGHLTGLPASVAWWGGVTPGHWSCGYLLNHAVDGGLLVDVAALLVPDRVSDLLLGDGVDGAVQYSVQCTVYSVQCTLFS